MRFEEYLTDDNIIFYIARARAKLAKRRNRRQLVFNLGGQGVPLTHASRFDDEKLLASILPPRRKWKKLDERSRRRASGQPLNSLDKTVRMLMRTVRWYRARESTAPFLGSLSDFCQEVRAYATGATPKLPRPAVLAVPKKPEEKECRPITVYPLAAKIAICLTNRYLSERFDRFFEPTSYAFRMPTASSGRARRPNHHDACRQIIQARRLRPRTDYWIAESDIQKFFDTVDHVVLKRAFRRLVKRVDSAAPDDPISPAAVRFFHAYLDSYTFNRSVLPLNDLEHGCFTHGPLIGWSFKWVKDELRKSGMYHSLNRAKIGVPQGGALSGLIANILLDRVDKVLADARDPFLMYVRYCDDMVIMHRRRWKCQMYLDMYETELRKLKLLPHPAQCIGAYGRGFWQTKSKKPYKWGPTGHVPWVGFVGYEVNEHGQVRVRKSSLRKEIEKQHETVLEVWKMVRAHPRASRRTIMESVTHRLIQMSVGRVRLFNYAELDSELCWVSGFCLVDDNRDSRAQMKRLDAARNRLIRGLDRALANQDFPDIHSKSKPRQRAYYGKPFSYYYHAIEKKRKE